MRRLKLEDRRQLLIEATIEVIAERGLAAASSRAITSRAEMPLGALHYAFDSVDDLMDHVVASVTDTERLEAEASWMLTAPASSGAADAGPSMRAEAVNALDAGDLIESALVAYIDLLRADPRREQAMLEVSVTAAHRAKGRDLVVRQYRAYHQAARAMLDALAESCEATWSQPVEDIARLVVVMTDGLTTTWLATRNTAAARTSASTLSRMLASLLIPVEEHERSRLGA